MSMKNVDGIAMGIIVATIMVLIMGTAAQVLHKNYRAGALSCYAKDGTPELIAKTRGQPTYKGGLVSYRLRGGNQWWVYYLPPGTRCTWEPGEEELR